MTQRGRVLRDTNVGPGLMTVGGKQFSFTLEDMWQSEMPPRPGMIVEVAFSTQGTPETLRIVPETQLAREQAEQALAEARKQGGAIASSIRARFGTAALVTEILLLISFFALPNMAFGNSYTRHPLTGWQVIGLDTTTGLATDHGLLSLLAVICFLAPFAVPFWHSVWSRWLYAAPLGFSVVAFLTIYVQIQRASHAAADRLGALLGAEAARQMNHEVSGMFAISFGAYLVFICAAYLATRSFKTNFQPFTNS